MTIEDPFGRKENKKQSKEGLCPKCDQSLSDGICNNKDCEVGGFAVENLKVIIRDKDGKEELCPSCGQPLYAPGRICLNEGGCHLANGYSIEKNLEDEVSEFLKEHQHREE